MNMIIVVMSFRAILFAERISDRIVCGWDTMNDAFLYKNLERPVDGHAIKLPASLTFNIGMRKCAFVIQKKFKDFFPATSNAELIFLQYVIRYFTHRQVFNKITKSLLLF
jgi:hypothetical protein